LAGRWKSMCERSNWKLTWPFLPFVSLEAVEAAAAAAALADVDDALEDLTPLVTGTSTLDDDEAEDVLRFSTCIASNDRCTSSRPGNYYFPFFNTAL